MDSELEWRLSSESLCCTRGGRDHELYWYPRDGMQTVEEAFERIVLPKFLSEYQAAQAIEDFREILARASRGELDPVYEARVINPDTTKPRLVYEIKGHWPNSRRSAKKVDYIGARLFHGEPADFCDHNAVVSTWLMVKLGDNDDADMRRKQTQAARSAAQALDVCEHNGWLGIRRVQIPEP